MASAFTLTLAYLGEECSAADAGGAFAAYITGNVASNLIGRLVSAAVADHLGLASNFYFFAVLNLAGAVLVYYTVAQSSPMMQMGPVRSPFAAWIAHLRDPRLRAAFGIGFCILFAFIGIFTYVNFVLVRPPLSLGPARIRLLRVPALGRDDTLGRSRSSSLGYPTDPVGIAGIGRCWPAAPSAASSCGGPAGHGARWRWDVFCPGDCDWFCEPSCHCRPRRSERHLSRLLLRRRPGWHRDPWSDLRSDRLARLRRWNRAVARCGSTPRCLPENDSRPLTPNIGE